MGENKGICIITLMHRRCSLLPSPLVKSNKQLHKGIGTQFRDYTCKHIYLYTPKDFAVSAHLVLCLHIQPGWLHSHQQCEGEVQSIASLLSAINMGSESGSFRLKYRLLLLLLTSKYLVFPLQLSI